MKKFFHFKGRFYETEDPKINEWIKECIEEARKGRYHFRVIMGDTEVSMNRGGSHIDIAVANNSGRSIISFSIKDNDFAFEPYVRPSTKE